MPLTVALNRAELHLRKIQERYSSGLTNQDHIMVTKMAGAMMGASTTTQVLGSTVIKTLRLEDITDGFYGTARMVMRYFYL